MNEIDADLIGLQEAVLEPDGCRGMCAKSLSAATGRVAISGPTFPWGNGHYGNVLLASGTILRTNRLDLSVNSREPRGAIDVTLDCSGFPVRVIVTHLGLRSFERKRQIETLLESVANRSDELVILMGDFNLWYPASSSLRRIADNFGRTAGLRTFPTRMPLLKLDRIWVQPNEALQQVEVHRSQASRVASDHFPIKGVIEWTKRTASENLSLLEFPGTAAVTTKHIQLVK